MTKIRRMLGNLGLIALSTYIGLIVVDLGLDIYLLKEGGGQPQGLYQVDKTRGYALSANFSGEVRKATLTPVQTNAHGYRDIEWKFDQPFRVLIVGDSFTFGSGMPIAQGFVTKAREKMKGDVAFYNAGVGGYGVAHVLETIRKECSAVTPRHIFYMYFMNDTRWDNMRADSTTVADGYLVSRFADQGRRRLSDEEIAAALAESLNRPSWSLRRSLRLFSIRRFISERQIHPRQVLERWFDVDGLEAPYTSRYMATNIPSAYPAENAPLAAGIISQMKNVAAECGANFTMIILPGYAEGYYGVIEPATARLMQALSGKGIEILDLRKNVAAGTVLSLVGDGHYNAQATDWTADWIKRELIRLYPELQP
jgi:hypothetical protein